MSFDHVPYQSFCWVLGTTSFRTAQLSLRTEEQLILLNDLRTRYAESNRDWQWEGNSDLQSEFYDLMRERGMLTGNAKLRDKDARQKTSALVTLGLVTDDREITEAGQELVRISQANLFNETNLLSLPADSYVYFKQLLKASLDLGDDRHVRPFFVLAYLLVKFDYLTFDEFQSLMPLVVDNASLEVVVDGISSLRRGEETIDDIVISVLLNKPNYVRAFKLLVESNPNEELITAIGMNRKSRSYDRKYFALYRALERAFLPPGGARDLSELIAAAWALEGTVGVRWRNLLFGNSGRRQVLKSGYGAVPESCPFLNVHSPAALKLQFFKHMHLYKAHATLKDYFDLNRRYFRLTDTLLFDESVVRFDSVPSAYFSLVSETLLRDMFVRSPELSRSVELEDMSDGLHVSVPTLLERLSRAYGEEIGSLAQARDYVREERYRRLHHLLDNRLTNDVLAELLDCFAGRDDERIAELVTDSATPSTVFEYVIGLIWYNLSGRSGDILRYMNLQLEADLMPRTHAQGGAADIVYEYEGADRYPAHSLLIEVTLADGTSTRKLEMEPVSRHLGNQVLTSKNSSDYCVFVAPQLDLNVVNDFRHRKAMGYFDPQSGEHVPTLKIIPLGIEQLKAILLSGKDYGAIYPTFHEVFVSEEMNASCWLVELEDILED